MFNVSFRFVLFAILATALFGQSPLLYQDPRQPLDHRVADLVSRMTLEEKASQLLSQAPSIDRLGVPAYDWWNECLHGVARAGRATVFPETIGMAATWDTGLLFRVSTAISDEARAKHHEFVRRGKRGIYEGLTFWTPNINLFRDPRWGRGMETYGEDPYLTARLAVQFIRGLQGDDPHYLKTVATAKHYAVHSGPESTRHVFDAIIDNRDLVDSYLPQFEAAVREGGAHSVMCAYNRIGGDPACANPRLLDDFLRRQWGFSGYVVSDCGAIGDIYQTHKSAPDAVSGVAKALQAGTDLDCGLEYEHLVQAVHQGLLTEAQLDTAVRRLFTARFQLGMFDPPELVRFAAIPYSENDSPAHHQLALETARKSIVLLKNQNHILPLSKNLKTLAVIGPNADSVEVLLGNYNGQPSASVTPLEGLRRKLGSTTKILYARGSDLAAGLPELETIPATALVSNEQRQPGLHAEYFASAAFNGRTYSSKAFSNRPAQRAAAPEMQPLFTRTDPQVDFDWHDGSPRKDLNDDDFGVRWTGFLAPTASGSYQLGATGLNAYELYFNNKLIAHRDGVHERGYEWDTVQLEAGKLYPIRLEFHEVSGDADIRLVWAPPHTGYEAEALDTARQADAVVMFMGLSPRLEGEEMKVQVEGFQGGDRVRLAIPSVQEDLIRKVSALGKPLVLVLLNGSAVAINWARDQVPGIVELWYPGQAGGDALADVLFGDYNPAGRLPVTFYQSEKQLPAFDDYNMKGRTYRYFQGQPLFPFGFGLSYTNFTYTNLRVATETSTASDLHVSVDVTNAGNLAGEEVVQLYLKHLDGGAFVPLRSLEGFQRIAFQPGEKKTVEFTLTPRQFSLATADARRRVSPGPLEISVGGKQPGFTGLADASTTQSLTARSRLTGEARMLPQ